MSANNGVEPPSERTVRLVSLRSRSCERARQWVSLDADGELSPFEHALLSNHVRRCGECAAFRLDVDGMTSQLRAAPLERLTKPIELPARRHVSFRGLQLAASAAAVLAIAFGSTMGAIGVDTSIKVAHIRSAYLESPNYELRLMRPVAANLLPNSSGRAI